MKKLVMLLLSALLAVSPAMAEETIEEQFTEIETEYQEELTTEVAEISTEYVEEETEAVTEEIVTEEIITEPEPVTEEPTTEEVVIEEPTTAIPEQTTKEFLIDAWSGTEQITDLKGTSSPEGSVLTWSPIPDAEGYLIGAIQNGNAYKQIDFIVGENNTRYVDKNASLTVYSYYWVFPYKKVDGKVVRGAASSKYVYGVKQLAAPQGVTATGAPGRIKLAWNPVPGKSGYIIKCRRGNGPVEVIADVWDESYSDQAAPLNMVSFYWIYAYVASPRGNMPGQTSTYTFATPLEPGTGFSETGKYYFTYPGINSTIFCITLHNDSAGNVSINSNVLAYDASNNLIGACNYAGWDATENGDDICLVGEFQEITADQISRLDYVLNTESSYYLPATPHLTLNHTIIGNKVVMTLSNTGNRTPVGSEVITLFLKNGKLVNIGTAYFGDSNGNIAPGQMISAETYCYDSDFDSVKLFIKSRILP